MNLSPSFTLEEMTASQTAVRAGIDNTPDPTQENNLRQVADVLEQVRSLLGCHPIHVSSGFRCALLNHLVGGAPGSAHMKGLAADITCPAYGGPQEIAEAIVASNIQFDQLIFEGTWVHIGLAEGLYDKPRRQVLTALFRPGMAVTYLPGLPAKRTTS